MGADLWLDGWRCSSSHQGKGINITEVSDPFWPCMISNLTHDEWVFAFLMLSLWSSNDMNVRQH